MPRRNEDKRCYTGVYLEEDLMDLFQEALKKIRKRDGLSNNSQAFKESIVKNAQIPALDKAWESRKKVRAT